MHLHLLLVAILQVITTTTVATFTGVDQLPTDALLYRGEIHTGNTPLPQHGTFGEVASDPFPQSSYQEATIITADRSVGAGMAPWHPTGASGPDPGQVTQNALPSAALCTSFQGACGSGEDGSVPKSRSDRKNCPTGIEWLALGLNFDRSTKSINYFPPIHSIEIYSVKNGGFTDPPTSANTFFEIQVFVGRRFLPTTKSDERSSGGVTLVHTQQCSASNTATLSTSNTCKIVLPRPQRAHHIWIKATVPPGSSEGMKISICDMRVEQKIFNTTHALQSSKRRIPVNDGVPSSWQTSTRTDPNNGQRLFDRPTDTTATSKDGQGTSLAFTSDVTECSHWAGSQGQTPAIIGKTFKTPRMISKVIINTRKTGVSNPNMFCDSYHTQSATLYCGNEFNPSDSSQFKKIGDIIFQNDNAIPTGARWESEGIYPICQSVWATFHSPPLVYNAPNTCGICQFFIYESIGNEFGVIVGKHAEDTLGLYSKESEHVIKQPVWSAQTSRYFTALPSLTRKSSENMIEKLQPRIELVHQDVTKVRVLCCFSFLL